MTAFTAADLPTGANAITTVEELVTWGTLILAENFNTATVIDGDARVLNQAAWLTFFVGNQSPAYWLSYSRLTFKMTTTWSQGSTKIWKNITPIGSTAIPASYKA